MKKLIAMLFVLVMLGSTVLAQGQGVHEPGTGIENPEIKEAGQGTGQGLGDGEPQLISAEVETEAGAGDGNQTRARNRELLQTGLENALSRVTNENARQRLQANLERWMEKYQERMQRMEGVEVEEVDEETGAVTVKAKEPVRFLGFIKGTATKRFQMDGKGNINERAPWYRFLYAEETTE